MNFFIIKEGYLGKFLWSNLNEDNKLSLNLKDLFSNTLTFP